MMWISSHLWKKKNLSNFSDVEPDQGGPDPTCCRWSKMFMSFEIHVEERLLWAFPNPACQKYERMKVEEPREATKGS